MKNIIRYIITFCLLIICISVCPRSYTFRGLSVTEGLSDLIVNAIYKDSVGFVWIGTGTSLERFDGVRIKHYPIPGANEKLKRVNAITETDNNQIWMGNGVGLWRLDKNKDCLEAIAPETINSGVRSLLYDGKGTLYIGSEQGLFIYREGKLEKVWIDPNMLSEANCITGLNLAPDGLLWMTTGRGLYSLHLSNRKITPYHYIVDEKHICSYNNIARIGSMLYLGTMGQGIIRFDTRTGQFSRFVDVGCNVISSLSGDGKSMLYVGTDGNGVHFVSTEKMEILRSFRHEMGKEGGLRSNSVYSVLVDKEGLIWVGFYQLGLDYTMYQSGLFTIYSYPPHFDSKDMPVRTLAINENEKLIGSRDGLFYIDEKNRRYKSFKAPLLRSSMIICSYAFRGEYYIGTYGGGMYVFNPVSMTIRDFDAAESLPFTKGHIFCIKSDNRDNLWIGTSSGVYCYKDGKRIAHYTSTDSKLPEGNVYEIFFDSTHKGWICTENGMCIWDPSSGSLKTDIFPEGFIHKEKIRVVYEDSRHDLYFMPDKGMLFVSDLSMECFRRLPPHTPLEGKDGMFMIEDNDGWLWIGTSNGMYHYDKKDNFIPYNFTDGIPSPIFINCFPAKDTDGNIWFGNSKGLLYLDTSRKNLKGRWRYPIAITDVFINGTPASSPLIKQKEGAYEISLQDAIHKNITIYTSGFSYTNPAFMSYEYKMDGVDEDWKTLEGNLSVTYYDLSSGLYRFRIRHTGNPDSETLLYVNIPSPVGIWSFVFIAIAVLTAASAFYLKRKKAIDAEPRQEPDTDLENLPRPVEPEETSVTALMEEAPGQPVQEPITEQPVQEPIVEQPVQEPVTEEKYKSNKVSAEECKRLAAKLELVMRKEKPYINPNMKIADLAATISTSAHTLSYLFNQHLNRNYYDYINDYRIAEFKLLVNKEEYSKYTLSALAELCGFSSRASFFRSFKKATGITPNEYIRSIGKDNE